MPESKVICSAQFLSDLLARKINVDVITKFSMKAFLRLRLRLVF